MKTEELLQALQNPANLYRGKPFWAWNGKLEINELKRQIDIMKKMGFGGFFMHYAPALSPNIWANTGLRAFVRAPNTPISWAWKRGCTTRTVGRAALAAAW